MTLRLADAILLGDSLKRRNPWLYYEEGMGCGCAIAGAFLAVGQRKRIADSLIANMKAHWPWVTKGVEMEISDRFFEVVSGEMTIEQLCDYVNSVDPTPRCEPRVQEPTQVEVRQESTVSHD